MKPYTPVFAGLSLVVLSLSAPAALHGQQTDSPQHEQHHGDGTPAAASAQAVEPPAPPQSRTGNMMARTKASGAHLDVLLKKVRAATGPAKIDAIEELLTALVEDRREHESMMGGMAEKMSTMHGPRSSEDHTPVK